MVQTCDSCGETVSVLLPLRIYEEGKYGDEMLNRWYCIPCWAIIIDTFKDEKENNNNDDEEDKPEEPNKNGLAVDFLGGTTLYYPKESYMARFPEVYGVRVIKSAK